MGTLPWHKYRYPVWVQTKEEGAAKGGEGRGRHMERGLALQTPLVCFKKLLEPGSDLSWLNWPSVLLYFTICSARPKEPCTAMVVCVFCTVRSSCGYNYVRVQALCVCSFKCAPGQVCQIEHLLPCACMCVYTWELSLPLPWGAWM